MIDRKMQNGHKSLREEKHIRLLVLCLPVLSLIVGCSGVRVRGTIAANVDRIPASLAIYPVLAGSVAGRLPHHPILRLSKMGGSISITPPAESKLVVTAESRAFTDLLTNELMA